MENKKLNLPGAYDEVADAEVENLGGKEQLEYEYSNLSESDAQAVLSSFESNCQINGWEFGHEIDPTKKLLKIIINTGGTAVATASSVNVSGVADVSVAQAASAASVTASALSSSGPSAFDLAGAAFIPTDTAVSMSLADASPAECEKLQAEIETVKDFINEKVKLAVMAAVAVVKDFANITMDEAEQYVDRVLQAILELGQQYPNQSNIQAELTNALNASKEGAETLANAAAALAGLSPSMVQTREYIEQTAKDSAGKVSLELDKAAEIVLRQMLTLSTAEKTTITNAVSKAAQAATDANSAASSAGSSVSGTSSAVSKAQAAVNTAQAAVTTAEGVRASTGQADGLAKARASLAEAQAALSKAQNAYSAAKKAEEARQAAAAAAACSTPVYSGYVTTPSYYDPPSPVITVVKGGCSGNCRGCGRYGSCSSVHKYSYNSYYNGYYNGYYDPYCGYVRMIYIGCCGW